MLVYEFMPNGSLAKHLFENSQTLSWNLRLKVALGAAKGLAFLHDEANRKPIVIHQDFRCSNVLLDSDYNAKLFHFHFAVDGPTNYCQIDMYSIGYLPPETAMTGRVTSMYDVYRFGVVLLEMLCGRLVVDENRPSEEGYLVSWAKPFLRNKDKIFRVLDPRLEWGKSSLIEAYKIGSLALRCTSVKVENRPSMAEVVEALKALQA
ncbi:hypothetical protein QJS04_geneDACA011282 [Acorus gramineus]|uniref:Protein kinase domain-containing protein n=1 Tax=Acorus gramineus TaxID=55184 RepID=A0AAV9AMN1_ACOGR|nr:hypothetical protein QJS04_geneDACA011282 [Acorus gramineus]